MNNFLIVQFLAAGQCDVAVQVDKMKTMLFWANLNNIYKTVVNTFYF